MKTLHIIVSDKVATYRQRDGYIVCGNSDYQVEFTFSPEWDAYPQKTARFIWNGKYVDVTFSGTVCPVPIVANTDRLEVGVYAKDLCTTTSAVITCRRSIRCNSNMECEGTVVIPEGAGEVKLQEKTAVKNGEVIADEGYDGLSKVTVNVPGGNEWRGIYKDGELYNVNEYVEYDGNVYICIEGTDGTQNPTNTEYWARVNKLPNTYGIEVTPTKDIQNIVPEGGFDGFDEVIVNPIPDEYIIPNLQEKTATKNGEVTADEGYTGLSKVTVDLPLLSKIITKNGTYKARNESADELQGIWMFKSDEITIPVSSSSPITYNVNFTTMDGKYTADSIRLVHTGEPYYVALAYELHFCGGNLGDEIVYKARYSDANGMWLYSRMRTITITSTLEEVTNGSALLAWLQANATKMPIEGYSEVIVNVEGTGSALPVEVATEAEMTELLTSGEVGGVYKYTGETTDTYENGALYVLEEEEAYFTIVQLGTEKTYQFEQSMTWADWCESDYSNDASYFITETNVCYIGSGNIVSYSNLTPVKPTDPINSNEKYTIVNSGGSND